VGSEVERLHYGTIVYCYATVMLVLAINSAATRLSSALKSHVDIAVLVCLVSVQEHTCQARKLLG
jgi:hypothetical protein